MKKLRIAIVGSGFAGSILARGLHLQGHRVTLLDRQRHPRFALGESSTPLAALSLERLAKLPGLEDLRNLAAYGRWQRELPRLRCGLKRGFTFYQHRPGEPYANGPENDSRLLVAASPTEAVADTHWLRADVDAYLFERAREEGVECLEEAEVTGVGKEKDQVGGEWRLEGRWQGSRFEAAADLLFDASGAGGFLARWLAIPRADCELETSLVYGHFDGLCPFADVAPGAELPPGPYPDERAAVHHLLREGWMYILPFDDGVVSAGFVLAEPAARERAAQLAPEAAWQEILDRYPTLAAQFEGATPVFPIRFVPRLQQRFERAAGRDWALLPHAFAFYSPMFSTGIAWSLLAIERLLAITAAAGDGDALAPGLARYDRLLRREASYLLRFVAGAYRAALRDFDLFCAWTDLYFAAASFHELRQRLCAEGGSAWAWDGFLGSTDPRMEAALTETDGDLRALAGPLTGGSRRRFAAAVRRRIEPYNVAGLADPARSRLYPVDLEALRRDPHKMGLTARELEERLYRLRGDS
jgi:FADH2 O2-dependent halogenase